MEGADTQGRGRLAVTPEIAAVIRSINGSQTAQAGKRITLTQTLESMVQAYKREIELAEMFGSQGN